MTTLPPPISPKPYTAAQKAAMQKAVASVGIVADCQLQFAGYIEQAVYATDWAPNANPAQQITPAVGSLGSNGVGLSDPAMSPAIHPMLITTLKQCGMSVIRMWLEGTIGNALPEVTWTNSEAYHAAGIQVIAVINFQNCRQRCQTPSDADWLATLNDIPPATQTGVWAFEVGNELDTFGPVTRGDVYWIGTPAQYSHLLALAYPVLSAKGYAVIAGNCLRSLNFYKSLPAGWNKNVSAIGRHFYESSAAANLAEVDELNTYAANLGLGVANTEGGIRNGDTVARYNELKALVAGLRTRAGIHCLFPLINIPGDPLDVCAPLSTSYQPTSYLPAYTEGVTV